ncbi:MAG: metallophosphoesterase, partial [bacterium]|nr:metallophosphoesterase [bacterium]
MSTQDRPLLTWLHLSDLHFGHGPTEHGWNQVLVLDTLKTTVKEARSKGEWPPIDLILVTGDVAFSGGGRPGQAGQANDEYQRAADWLNQVAAGAGLGPEAVFVVPGNHDVDRSRDQDRDTRRLIKDLRAGESIDEALKDPGDRKKLCSRQEHYLEFARSWAEPCRGGELYWSHRGTSRGLSYRLAGLNTALLCAGDQDHGKLAAGNEQLVRLFVDEPIAAEELVIVLSHHPLTRGWLADERDIWDQVRARAHLHLSGHLHEAHSEWSQTGSGDEIVRVVAGAAHAEAGHSTHGFKLSSVIRCPDGGLAVEVRPFLWSRNRFIVDNNILKHGCDRATYPLRSAPKTVPPVEDEPANPTPAGELRQEVHDDLLLIFAGDAALASCFAAEYGSSEPEALAEALSSAPLAESLGRFFAVYEAWRPRLQSGSGFREVIAVILRLATQWDTVCRWRESHADGDRRFRLAQFRKHYLVQIAARLIQGSRRLGLEPGERSAPKAPDVVEPGLDP